jgi:phage terminase large subunit-like protein
VARRRKRLVDVVRDGTFLARKDDHLLARAGELPWPGLDEYRTTYQAQTDEAQAYEVARELERQLKTPDAQARILGDLQAELRKLGPPGSFEQLEGFFPRFFRHFKGPRRGQPFALDSFQAGFLREFWRRQGVTDRHPLGRRVYAVGLWGGPKGTGKTPTAAVLGAYAEVSNDDAPDAFVFAGSKTQAGRGWEFLLPNIEEGPLAAWLEISGGLILYPDVRGSFELLSSDGDLAAGIEPSAAVGDELWEFRHRKQRELWSQTTKGLHKRGGESWALGLSTAGWTKESLLGEIFDAAVKHPACESLEDGYLLRLRDEDAGFLMEWWAAPDEADIEDPAVVRRANPAPWVDPVDILADLHRPGTDEYDWRRLNLNQWTKSRGMWLPPGAWAKLEDAELTIPRGAAIYVGVDAAHSYDTCAVAWAWRSPSGRIVLRCRVWSVREDAAAHEYVDDFYNEDGTQHVTEPFIHALADEHGYRIQEVVFEPPRYGDAGRRLANRFKTAGLEPTSKEMLLYVQEFYRAAQAGSIAWHDADAGVFKAHIAAIEGRKDSDGFWRLKKLLTPNPMDAGTAAIIARGRAARQVVASEPLIAFR